MQYLLKQNDSFYFRRKIPTTTKNITFSLETKNGKIAKQKLALFLHKATPLFLVLKNQDKDEVLKNLDDIRDIFEQYGKEALIEYSELEKERHKHLICVSKKGKKRDGSHPKCIKKWLKKFQDTIAGDVDNPEVDTLFNEVFRRTKLDGAILDNLNDDDKLIAKFFLIKEEAKVLQNDLQRAENYFGTNVQTTLSQYQAMQTTPNRYYEKTIDDIAEDFFRVKENDTKEMHKYKEPFEIFRNVIGKKYFIDITAEDMQDVVYVFKNLPPKVESENIELYNKFKGDYRALVEHVVENGITTINLTTAQGKLSNLMALVDYAVDRERLDKNRLRIKHVLPSKKELENAQEKDSATRVDFKTNELNALFNESTWYTEKLNHYLQHEQDRIYIPLMGLLQGMRLNEIAQLYVNDIIEDDGIHYIRIDQVNPQQKYKNKSAKRKVPIHSKLIELGFLSYVQKVKKSGEERVFHQLYHTEKKGYGQAFSKKFANKNFKIQWIEEERLKDKRTLVDFHSFRHCFATRIVGRIEDSTVDGLMGHQGKSENKIRYDHKHLKILKAGIEKLDIEDIDFSHLQAVINSIK